MTSILSPHYEFFAKALVAANTNLRIDLNQKTRHLCKCGRRAIICDRHHHGRIRIALSLSRRLHPDNKLIDAFVNAGQCCWMHVEGGQITFKKCEQKRVVCHVCNRADIIDAINRRQEQLIVWGGRRVTRQTRQKALARVARAYRTKKYGVAA